MARGVNKVKTENIEEEVLDEFELYISGKSISDISAKTGIPKSTLRFRFQKAGILRTRAEGVRLAAIDGKMGRPGPRPPFSDEWRANIAKAKKEAGQLLSDAISIKKNGYAEFTRGKYKGRFVHVVMMELKLGRALLDDECVHHIDGDRVNNSFDNLALLTRSGHSKLHRIQDQLAGKQRERNENGTWR
jgi:hypothetical protein